MIVTKSRHERELADKQAEIDGLMARLQSSALTASRVFAANTKLARLNEELRKRIKPFERTRDPRGRFVKKGDGL